jgi:hypothetical protein
MNRITLIPGRSQGKVEQYTACLELLLGSARRRGCGVAEKQEERNKSILGCFRAILLSAKLKTRIRWVGVVKR